MSEEYQPTKLYGYGFAKVPVSILAQAQAFNNSSPAPKKVKVPSCGGMRTNRTVQDLALKFLRQHPHSSLSIFQALRRSDADRKYSRSRITAALSDLVDLGVAKKNTYKGHHGEVFYSLKVTKN